MIKKNEQIYQHLQQDLESNTQVQLEEDELTSLLLKTTNKILPKLSAHETELAKKNEELQQAYHELAASRDHYIDLYESAPVGYLTLATDGTIIEINRTAATLLSVNSAEIINQPFEHYIASEDRYHWNYYFINAKQQGNHQAIDLNLLRADNVPFYAHINSQYIEVNDKLSVVRLALTDITERKQAEDALRKDKERLAFILEGSELTTWDWNVQTGHVLYGKRWIELCGYPTEEVEQHIRFWEQCVFPDDFPRVQHELAEHFNGNNAFYSSEYRLLTKAGELLWIMARGKLVQRDAEGNPLRMTGIAINISERKTMEARLRVAAVAFETQAGIIVTDANRHIICVNKAFTCITGYSANVVIGQTPSFLRSGLHNEDFYQNLWQSVKCNGHWQGEIWNKRKNGNIFPCWHTLTAVIDTEGCITHYVGSLTDLTTQKQAEQVLLDARERLENQVVSTQEELQKIREESVKINTALNVLLKHRETDKSEAQNALSREVESTVLPFLKRLKRVTTNKNQTHLINILEGNLEQLVKFYGRDASLSSVYQKLTPAEIQVASMIRQGLPTKIIATTLNLSAGTISIHRKHIRRKLELNSKEINLYSYLNSLID